MRNYPTCHTGINPPERRPIVRLDMTFLRSCLDADLASVGDLAPIVTPQRRRKYSTEQLSAQETWSRLKPAYENLISKLGVR